jgi:hypothetical protein
VACGFAIKVKATSSLLHPLENLPDLTHRLHHIFLHYESGGAHTFIALSRSPVLIPTGKASSNQTAETQWEPQDPIHPKSLTAVAVSATSHRTTPPMAMARLCEPAPRAAITMAHSALVVEVSRYCSYYPDTSKTLS